MLYVPVAQVVLNRSRIVAIIRQLVACAVSQHVRVYGISIFADSPAPFLFFCGEDRAIVCTCAQPPAGPTFGFSTQDVDSWLLQGSNYTLHCAGPDSQLTAYAEDAHALRSQLPYPPFGIRGDSGPSKLRAFGLGSGQSSLYSFADH